jgi:hypothetical protein
MSGYELILNGSQNPNKWKPHSYLLRLFASQQAILGNQALQLHNDLVTMLDNQGNMPVF